MFWIDRLILSHPFALISFYLPYLMEDLPYQSVFYVDLYRRVILCVECKRAHATKPWYRGASAHRTFYNRKVRPLRGLCTSMQLRNFGPKTPQSRRSRAVGTFQSLSLS